VSLTLTLSLSQLSAVPLFQMMEEGRGEIEKSKYLNFNSKNE
jgi:hypothetical protein